MQNTSPRTIARPQTTALVNTYVRSVYNWMAAGLALTGGIAYLTANTEALRQLVFGAPGVFFMLIIVQLGLVFWLSARIAKMSAGRATTVFMTYAGLNGLTLSFIFLAYTQASIASTFFVCAGTFVGASFVGWTTKRDLTSIGGFLMMGLIGIILATVVNIFMKSPAIYWAVTYIGVAIFVGLTVYDTQKIKNMALSQPADADESMIRKAAITGALALYLDFINLFLLMLRIFGNSRN
jgi:hypothetical protein